MPARSGAIINHSRPRAEIKKLPAYLQQLGYEVASFGKVAHYNHGPEYGFDLVQGEGFHKHEGIGQAVEFLECATSRSRSVFLSGRTGRMSRGRKSQTATPMT